MRAELRDILGRNHSFCSSHNDNCVDNSISLPKKLYILLNCCIYVIQLPDTNAAKCYTAMWGININELTARRLKSEYLQKLNQEIAATRTHSNQGTSQSSTIEGLETKERGRPLLVRFQQHTYQFELFAPMCTIILSSNCPLCGRLRICWHFRFIVLTAMN